MVESLAGGGATQKGERRALWLRWVGANTLGEAVGLGATALVGLVVATVVEGGRAEALLPALFMILSGALLEGAGVGTLQWLVLRRLFPNMAWLRWASATALGAGIAWTLGMIPSTLTVFNADAATTTEIALMSDLAMSGMAALMGLMLGTILGFPQSWILHDFVEHASRWIPANALAWMPGMVIIFLGAGAVPTDPVGPETILAILLILAAAGAVVGAIHGAVLLWLAQEPKAAFMEEIGSGQAT